MLYSSLWAATTDPVAAAAGVDVVLSWPKAAAHSQQPHHMNSSTVVWLADSLSSTDSASYQRYIHTAVLNQSINRSIDQWLSSFCSLITSGLVTTYFLRLHVDTIRQLVSEHKLDEIKATSSSTDLCCVYDRTNIFNTTKSQVIAR